MRYFITSVADSRETAKALDLYIQTTMADEAESRYMTYHDSLYSGELVRETDLFVLELFATDTVGQRAEGILGAEAWAALGKRVLILSGSASANEIHIPYYWDLSSHDNLKERILSVLAAPTARRHDLLPLRDRYHAFCRAAEDPHVDKHVLL